MKQESKRHHYIPQFILRNFQDENLQVTYWDIEKGKLEKRNTKSVFMNMNMYRDEINHHDNPTSIEGTLAVFESEIAEFINKKLLTGNEITITRKELEKLRIFLSLLSFRSNLRMEQYQKNDFNESTRKILENYSPEGLFFKIQRLLFGVLLLIGFDEMSFFDTLSALIVKDSLDAISKAKREVEKEKQQRSTEERRERIRVLELMEKCMDQHNKIHDILFQICLNVLSIEHQQVLSNYAYFILAKNI